MQTSKRLLVLVASCLAAGVAVTTAALAAPARSADEPSARSYSDSVRGLVYTGLVRDHKNCDGAYRVATLTTKGRVACTHGPDPAPAGVSVKDTVRPVEAGDVQPQATCDGDGTSGYRVQVLYVRASDKASRFAQYAGSIRTWANDADDIYYQSAVETGGDRRLRFVHDSSCTIDVREAVVQADGDDDLGRTADQLKALGYNRTDRKYMLFVDSNVYCGIGYIMNDDRADASNYNNSGPTYGRTDTGCWGGRTAAHELNHNLGGVQLSAPNTSAGWHCTDEYDVMCYSDSPNYPPMKYVCTSSSHDQRLDCNHDDYYSTNPPAGSYLATHWNTANSRFLIGAGSGGGGGGGGKGVGAIVGLANKCVDVASSNSADGTAVWLYTCNGTDAQKWTVGADGTIRAFGKCLQTTSTADGAETQISGCTGASAQKWTVSGGEVKQASSGKCLDVAGSGTDDGTTILIWPCHSGANQKWTMP